jgi:hypothetical protein
MQSYRRVAPDQVPPDVVVVNLWRAAGRTVADVCCTGTADANDYAVAEFPRPVAIALERAKELRDIGGLSEVVVVVPDKALWRPNWGRLVDEGPEQAAPEVVALHH